MLNQLTAADGHELDCWIELAIGEQKGGIVILQEIFGITDQLKGVARKYAAHGYDVAIPALFDRQERGAVIPFEQGPRGRDLMLGSKIKNCMADAKAAVDTLAARGGKVAVMGFCWGGGLALRAAQKLDIACAIAFYGTRLDQYLDCPLKAPFLGHFGTKDEHVPAEMLDALKAYLPEVEIHMYETGHAFANDARPTYTPDAAEAAHALTIEYLRKHL